jgi:glucose-6-phosphate dehydrogenase assembly protein OpcA
MGIRAQIEMAYRSWEIEDAIVHVQQAAVTPREEVDLRKAIQSAAGASQMVISHTGGAVDERIRGTSMEAEEKKRGADKVVKKWPI